MKETEYDLVTEVFWDLTTVAVPGIAVAWVILIVAFGSVITAVICGTVVVPTVSSAVYVVVH
jgi:hypothetical protein